MKAKHGFILFALVLVLFFVVYVVFFTRADCDDFGNLALNNVPARCIQQYINPER